MKKLSEILANKAKPEEPIKVNTEASAPPVLESESIPNSEYTKRYMSLLEGFGAKSILDLDEKQFDQFHTEVLKIINE
jgi:hypothetical protein